MHKFWRTRWGRVAFLLVAATVWALIAGKWLVLAVQRGVYEGAKQAGWRTRSERETMRDTWARVYHTPSNPTPTKRKEAT